MKKRSKPASKKQPKETSVELLVDLQKVRWCVKEMGELETNFGAVERSLDNTQKNQQGF